MGDYFLGARIAAGGSLTAAALCLLLPTDLDKASASGAAVADTAATGKPPAQAKDASKNTLSWPVAVKTVMGLVWLYLFSKISTGIANSIARSSQPIVLK